MLWRDLLRFHRARMQHWLKERDELVELLGRKRMPKDMRIRLEASLLDLSQYLDPPVFNRPRKNEQ